MKCWVNDELRQNANTRDLIFDIPTLIETISAGITLQPGDIIVEFNGRPVVTMRDLPKIVAETPIGTKVPVKVLRKGKEVAITAEVGRLEDGEKLADAAGSKTAPAPDAPAVITVLGMTVTSITDELRTKYGIDKDIKGAVVTEVAQDGAAADKRLEPGDVITEAGEQEVQGAADISTRVEAAKKAGKNSILLLIAKGGKSAEMRFIALKLK